MHAMRGLAVMLLAGVVRGTNAPSHPEEEQKEQKEVSWGESGGIKFTATYANDLFKLIPRTGNKILAREETKKWLGKMWSPRSLPAEINNLMKCDACALITPLIHDDLDLIRHKYQTKEPIDAEMISERFYHDQADGDWCLNITNLFSLRLDKERNNGGMGIPKYVRGAGVATVKGGWPEGFFFETCDDMFRGATPELLVAIAVARGDQDLKWGRDGQLDLCESRYHCPPSTDQTRTQQAKSMLAKVHDYDSEEKGLDAAFEELAKGGDLGLDGVLPEELKEVFKNVHKMQLPEGLPDVPEAAQKEMDEAIDQALKSREMSAEAEDEWDAVDKASTRLLAKRQRVKAAIRKAAEERARQRADGNQEEL